MTFTDAKFCCAIVQLPLDTFWKYILVTLFSWLETLKNSSDPLQVFKTPVYILQPDVY